MHGPHERRNARCIFHLLESKHRRAISELRVAPDLHASISLAREFAMTRDGFWMRDPSSEGISTPSTSSSLLLIRAPVLADPQAGSRALPVQTIENAERLPAPL